MTRDYIFRNTFKDIETIVATIGAAGHALRVRVLRRRPALQRSRTSSTAGSSKPPLFVQTIFGILGGIGPERREPPAHEGHGRPPVRRRLPAGRSSAPGRHQTNLVTIGRDHRRQRPRRPRGQPLPVARAARASNAEQVEKIVRILRRAVARGRHAGRGARDAALKGPDARPRSALELGEVLLAELALARRRGPRRSSSARSSTRRILPEIVFGSSANSSRRIALVRREALAAVAQDRARGVARRLAARRPARRTPWAPRAAAGRATGTTAASATASCSISTLSSSNGRMR